MTLQNRQATGVTPTRKGSVCPPPIAGEQSGDRQRREKGPPILTAEKGELRARTNVHVGSSTVLRATLRAPPSKWAIKGFFPRRVSEANRGRGQPRRGYRRPKPATRSGAGRKSCRAAGFLLHTFLSPSKEKCERPMGRPVPIRAGVGASGPLAGIFYNKVGLHHCLQGAFRSPPAPLRFACRNKDPRKAANPALRRGRPIPYWGR